MDNIQVGDVVQIDPHHGGDFFGACFAVVTELKPAWQGFQGYVTVPDKEGGQAFLRMKLEHVVRIGKAEWIVAPIQP